MTRIPPEHPGAKSLEHAFRSLGTEKARERRRERSGRLWRLALATATPIFAVAAVATGTKVFTGDGGALRPDRPGARDPEGRVDLTPGSRQLAAASASDPVDGPPWGVRVYETARGRTCVTVGRVVAQRLGVVREGQFQELPDGSPGQCNGEGDPIVASVRTYPGRAALYGAVDRTIRRLHLLTQGGHTAEVAIARDGTFIIVRKGPRAFRHQLLIVDGASRRLTIPLDPR